MSNNQTIIGLDIGGTNTAVVEGTKEAEILQRHEYLTQAEKPFSEISDHFFNVINEITLTTTMKNKKPIAISIIRYSEYYDIDHKKSYQYY